MIRSSLPRSHVTRFNYGAARQRLRRYDFAGSIVTESNQGKVTHYAGDAEVTTKPDGSTEVRRYISGMTQVQQIPVSGAVQLRREYLMTDALGSTHRIVSEQAAIIPDSRQAFATFGERANADDRLTLSDVAQANFNAVLPRGYTGHQQADEVGIIHMNGRIYDLRCQSSATLKAAAAYCPRFTPSMWPEWAIAAYAAYRRALASVDPNGFLSGFEFKQICVFHTACSASALTTQERPCAPSEANSSVSCACLTSGTLILLKSVTILLRLKLVNHSDSALILNAFDVQ